MQIQPGKQSNNYTFTSRIIRTPQAVRLVNLEINNKDSRTFLTNRHRNILNFFKTIMNDGNDDVIKIIKTGRNKVVIEKNGEVVSTAVPRLLNLYSPVTEDLSYDALMQFMIKEYNTAVIPPLETKFKELTPSVVKDARKTLKEAKKQVAGRVDWLTSKIFLFDRIHKHVVKELKAVKAAFVKE